MRSEFINLMYHRAIGKQLPVFPKLQTAEVTLFFTHSPAVGEQPVLNHFFGIGGKLG